MIDLSVRGLVKGFEQGNDILKGITFDINAGERVGILGRNGCGKTTFFRILSGELQPDAGTVSVAAGRRLGLISQIPVYPDGWTTEDVLREAHRRLYDMEARMNELTARMACDDSAALLAEYDHSNLSELADFQAVNPTSENLARTIYRKISEKMNSGTIRVHRVRVGESDHSAVTYFED